jgi:hypothetical protein
MRCEKCGKELFRGALVCRHCRFDNGQRGRGVAAKAGHALTVEGPAARSIPSLGTNSATRTATREAVARVSASESEGNLIPFPVGIPYGSGSQTIQIPPVRTRETEGPAPPSWREQVREKVKASRERKVEVATPATPTTPATPPQAKEVSGTADPRPHNELVESALNRIRRTTADLTASARAPRAMPAPPSVRPPTAREEVTRPVTPSQVEERLSSVAPPASLPDAPAARQQGVLAPTPGVIREKSEGRQVVTVPPTAPPTRAKTTDELVEDARRLAQQAAPPMEAPPEREAMSQPPARPRVETEIVPLSTLLRSLGMQEERPASFWIRSMAGGWDLEVLAVAYLPIFASYATVNTILARETLVVLAALLVVLVFVYQSVTLLLAGRTFGMAMQQLRLAPLATGATRIYWHQHLRRAAGATLAFCCPPLNLLARALHRRGLSIPDQFSGTIPVEIPRSPRAH